MELSFIKELIKGTDPLVLTTLVVIYLVLINKIALIKKDVERIDKSTNHRKEGQITMSQEVSEINQGVSKLYTKIELHANDLEHVKEQIKQHREEDEKVFNQLAEDIHKLACKPAPRRTSKKS